MNTIKVRITIYHTIYSDDQSHIESAQQLLTEIQTIELTDEQLQYLREHDGMVEDNTPANFKDLRQDFQEIALRLSQSSMEYLHSDEMLGADIPLDYEVCYDSGVVPLRSKYWIEDGILYCHENSGLIVVVHCMDDKRESFSCDFAHEIGGSAFSDCRYLKEVHLPNTLEIAPYAFAGCTNLQNVELCKEQITIMENAFEGCVMLRELHLPSEKVMISREAFRHCINLSRLSFGDMCFTPDDAPKDEDEQFILNCELCIHDINKCAFAYTPLAYLSDNNEDDEDDDDLETEFDDDLDFSDLFNSDKSKEKDVSEELQGNMLAAFHGVTHHNVYAEIPFMLHAGLTSSAEALLKKMAVDTLDFTTDGGKRIIVAKIPELTSEAGFVACILALTFEGNAGKYYIVELDDDQYFLDQMEHGCHKTYGARWTELPTLQQVTEEIIGLNG